MDASSVEPEKKLSRKYSLLGTPRSYDFSKVYDRLGKETDAALAREVGCTRMGLRYLRLSLGIPRCDRVRPGRHLLGRLPDDDLARRLRCSVRQVRYARQAAQLSSYNPESNPLHPLLKYIQKLRKEMP